MIIYRGVNAEMDERSNGIITPKGEKDTYDFTADTTLFTADNAEVTVNGSKINAVYVHQHELVENKDSAWISCSCSFDVAQRFATLNGMVNGYIYELDTDLFELHNVEMIGVLESAPEKGEQELSIREKNGRSIPADVIKKKHCIKVE